MKRIFVILAVAGMATAAASGAYAKQKPAGPESKAVMKQLAQAISAVKNYTADFTMTTKLEKKKSKITGTIAYEMPDKARIEMKTTQPRALSQLTVSDGKLLWQYVPEDNLAFVYDLSKMKKEQKRIYMSQGDLTRPFKDMDPNSIRFKGETNLGGERTYLFEGKPALLIRVQDDKAFSAMKVWVGAEDGLIRKVIIFDQKQKETLVQDYNSIKVNTLIDESVFKFTPPQGTMISAPAELKQF